MSTRSGSGRTGARTGHFLIKGLISRSTRSGSAPAGPGPELVIFVIRGLLAGAPEVAPAGLGPESIIFLLSGLLARAPEVAPDGLGPELVIFF